ncbi:hypothetical protein M407DRAFT_23128 [Tulasnella calospora MUT 4182]|uniref:Uncharacterized protein n=1 Tax=Tulasnella calospora MUT 4182 TaxID=1051891 RepID=A0A0C3QB13_9AGAM|nr:hypothetical protein M407DRAFT_23128 [Tulasnella calospora MUT 4182]
MASDDALQQTAADTNGTSGTRSTVGSDNATSPQSTLNITTDSGDATPAVKPAPTTPAKDLPAPPATPARSTTRSTMAKTPASVDGIGKLIGSDDGDEAGEYSGDEGQKTTPKTPQSSNTLAAIAPLDPALAAAWDMSETKKALVLKLLDVHSGSTFAIRRMPTTFRYGSGEHRDRLVSSGRPVTVILVGRISQVYFETTKLAANVNVVPLLAEDLSTARPNDYLSIRASVNQVKKPGTGTYRLFDEIYNATQGLKRKKDEGAKLGECLEIGDLVAVELYVKRYSRQNEKARHASFELVAIQLLRRGSPNEVKEVQASVSPKKTDAFSDEFFSEL